MRVTKSKNGRGPGRRLPTSDARVLVHMMVHMLSNMMVHMLEQTDTHMMVHNGQRMHHHTGVHSRATLHQGK